LDWSIPRTTPPFQKTNKANPPRTDAYGRTPKTSRGMDFGMAINREKTVMK
jgi:hypothetical protein